MTCTQGIYGGTFDPVHFGHLQLIETLLKKTAIQSIRIIPCHIPAHRPTPHATPEQRLTMLKLATAHLGDKVIIDDYELKREQTSYTIHTIEHLKKLYPDMHFTLIMGADAWKSFTSWHRHEDILRQIEIMIAARNAIKLEALNEQTKLSFFNDFHSPVSSTLVRSALLKREDCSAYLPRAVYDYILKNKLY